MLVLKSPWAGLVWLTLGHGWACSMGLEEWVNTSQVTEWAYTQVLYSGHAHRSLPCGQYKHSHCKSYPDISVPGDMHETLWEDVSILVSSPTCARVNAGGSYPFLFVLFISPFLLPSLLISFLSPALSFPIPSLCLPSFPLDPYCWTWIWPLYPYTILNLGNTVLGEVENSSFIALSGKGGHSRLTPSKPCDPPWRGQWGVL